ncbi:hypothetical protein HJP15_03455 [Pseudoalteromonas sp. NEC-BIFX-2020_002]|uniref:Uncharacterized protein n=1 Tax=Pseudoalteromonas porphyrae TaxID=187330 RepID=A0A0N1EHT9_9GAMM|nr:MULTISPECIES: hypothetical protein [Pseudoalteromonas]KPH61917.1 hypothetical protein ADS77_13260 [Pseudoalteromonas porphyrae]NNG42006.1 hypothetical protein [Pseudoalteromonas sp. NEC-BIFX-2020_002]
MIKNIYLSLLLAFLAGVTITSVFFGFIASSQLAFFEDDVQSEQAFQTFLNESDSIKLPPAPVSATQSQTDIAGVNISAISELVNPAPLEAQLEELRVELETQRKLVKVYEKRLNAPTDLEQALLTQFDEQTRNEEWAYRTETAMKDFLQTADLSITPDMVNAQCKSSVCKFDLSAPKDMDDFNHIHWRELNDKLVKQEFWQQFTVSTSKSSDRDFSLLLATESK